MSMYTRIHRTVIGAVALVAVAVVMTACGATPQRGELADNQRILASCDPSAPPASLVAIDGTGSSASEEITAERMTAIESIARRTAICSGGPLRVLVFSASSAATTTLFDKSLHLEGATDNARLQPKRVNRVVDDAMAEIRAAYEPAVAALPGGSSDITAQYRLASEWIRQVGGDFRLHLYVFTDGFQTAGVNLYDHALSTQEAEELADRVSMPKLSEATVVVAGLGRVADSPPSSDVVEGLVAYYDALCHRSGADDCLSVTDYSAAGQ